MIIEKMIKCISKISEYTNGISYEQFTRNSMLVEACVFNLRGPLKIHHTEN